MSKPIDLANQTFGRWTVLSRASNNKRGETMWNCRCECGKEKVVNGYSLRNGASKSCGCLQKEIVSEMNFDDLTGRQFSNLTVLEFIGKDKSKKTIWKCQCNCEGKTIIVTRGDDLRSRKTKSCGCLKSVGEEKISSLLTIAGLQFEKEKTFDACRFPDTNALARFDFYVNNQYLIEFDGIQHFSPTFGEDALSKTQEHDIYKNNWCKANDIPLIRINYLQLENLKIEDIIL